MTSHGSDPARAPLRPSSPPPRLARWPARSRSRRRPATSNGRRELGLSRSSTRRAGGTFGGALRYTFWRGAFVSAGARTFSKDGERVFVAPPERPRPEAGLPAVDAASPRSS